MLPPPPTEATIHLEEVSRWYGPVIGLNSVSLRVEEGVTGLLGPNGAGKSTLLKLVSGQIRPSQGSVRVFGREIFGRPAVLGAVGISPDTEELLEWMTGREMVRYLLRLGGFRRRESAAAAADSLERVGLAPVADRRVSTYSKGMRQRLRLAQAIAHDPPLIILDEPLTGLDPVGRRELIELIRGLAGRGRTIIISGHVLHEVEMMTRRIILIHRGQILAEGTLEEIRQALDQRPHSVRVVTPDARRLAQELIGEEGTVSVELSEDHVQFQTRDPERFFTRLMELATSGALTVQAYETTDDNLQSIFDYLVG